MKPSIYTTVLNGRKKISLILPALTALSILMQPALAQTDAPAAQTTAQPQAAAATEVFNDSDDKEHENERKEIQNLLDTIESQWNAHDAKALMANYSEDYINNDGLDKRAVQKLTEDFWKTYPDARSGSKTKSIRIEGNYATIESRDTAVGTTELQGMTSKGELQSVSEGQLYMKRLGNIWRIIGDRIDYEKVRVSFGLAKHLSASFSAPEQVLAGKQYSAKLEVTLPPGLVAMGSITNQPLKFPQPSPQEKPRQLDQPSILERVMSANLDNHNELLTATVILVDPNHRPMGVIFLTKRLNVVPEATDNRPESTTASSGSDNKVASESKETESKEATEKAAESESKAKDSEDKAKDGEDKAKESDSNKSDK